MNDKTDQPTASVKITHCLGNVCLGLAALGLCSLVVLNGMNVLSRVLFNSPFTWVDECMTFVMMVSVLAGAIGATAKDCHINVDLVRQLMSATVNRVLHVLGSLLTIGVLVLMGVASVKIVNVLRMFDQRSDAMEVPVWLVQSAVPLFMFISALLIVCKLFGPARMQVEQDKEH